MYKEIKRENDDILFKTLAQFYDKLGGDGWFFNFGWKDKDVPICKWYGVECNSECTDEENWAHV